MKDKKIEFLLNEIKQQQIELEQVVFVHKKLIHPKVIEKSQKLDALVIEYYKMVK